MGPIDPGTDEAALSHTTQNLRLTVMQLHDFQEPCGAKSWAPPLRRKSHNKTCDSVLKRRRRQVAVPDQDYDVDLMERTLAWTEPDRVEPLTVEPGTELHWVEPLLVKPRKLLLAPVQTQSLRGQTPRKLIQQCLREASLEVSEDQTESSEHDAPGPTRQSGRRIQTRGSTSTWASPYAS